MAQSRAFKAGVLSSGTFLTKLSQLLCAAILARLLSETAYGAYRETLMIYNIAAPFLALGLPMALYYFLPRQPEKSKSLVTANLMLLSFMGLLFALFLWLGGAELLQNRFEYQGICKLLLILSPYALLALPARSVSASLVTSGKIKHLAVYNVSSKLLYLVFVVGLVLIWQTPQAAIAGAVVANLIVLIPALILMYRFVPDGPLLPSKKNLIEQLKYSVPLGLAIMIGTLFKNIDKYLVADMTSPKQFAVYINGAMEIPLIQVITGSIMVILIPEFASLYKSGNIEKIVHLWQKAMTKCSLFIFPIMIFLFIMAEEVMRVIFSAKFTESSQPFRVYLLLLPIRITQFGAIYMAVGKNRSMLNRSLIALALNFALSIFMIKKFGPIGAAFASVSVLYLFSTPFNLFFVRKQLNVSLKKLIPLRPLLKIMSISLAAAITLIPVYWLRFWPDLLKLFVFTPAYMIAVILLFDFFEIVKIKDVLNSIRAKLKI